MRELLNQIINRNAEGPADFLQGLNGWVLYSASF